MQPEPVGPARARPGRAWADPSARGLTRPGTAKIRGPVAREADADPKGQIAKAAQPTITIVVSQLSLLSCDL
jgi:hypothetical protein